MGLLMVLKDIKKLQHNHIQHKKFGFILNPKIGQHTRITNSNLYENYPTIQKDWTQASYQKCKKYKIGHNSNHLFTCVQFPVQPTMA
jgi:hypothetical protein